MRKALKFRALTLNMHKGFSSFNRRFVLHELKEAIHKTHADIVFLQEVAGEHGKQHHYEFLADTVWDHAAYGKNAVYPSGHHGNAILSKFPIIRWKNIDLTTYRLEQRGFLYSCIEDPKTKKKIHCVCTHLGLVGFHRKEQYRRLIKDLQKRVPKNEPLIIAGDFNDWTLAAKANLAGPLGLTEVFHSMGKATPKTFPSWFPTLRLDRIYARGLKVKSAKVLKGKLWSELSDHLGLLTEIEL